MFSRIERVLTIAAAVSLGLAVLATSQANAQTRLPYRWEVSLDRGTKAVVGPLNAERMMKIRIDRPEGSLALLPDEELQICLERYCETADLGEAGKSEDGLVPTVDFTRFLASSPGDYRKSYLTLMRKSPSNQETLSISINVETDHTAEMPQFSALGGIDAATRELPQHEHDGMNAKSFVIDVELPAAHAPAHAAPISAQ